jgi:DNA replication protein DnaC
MDSLGRCTPAELPLILRQADCNCNLGIVNPPELTNMLSIVEERIQQYEAGLLQFCDCELGQRAQRFYAERAGNPYGRQLAAEAARRRAAHLQKIDGLQDHERAINLAGFIQTKYNREAIAAVAAGIEQRRGLITLWGPFGTGKTGLMMAAVNACRDRDMAAMYRTTADALAWLRAGFDQSARDGEDFSYDKRWQLLTGAGCLALDEMTAFSVTPWAAERFERLIDERWRSMPELLTICAFNAESAGSAELMQTGLPAVVESRLRDRRAQWIHMGGMDMRQVRA